MKLYTLNFAFFPDFKINDVIDVWACNFLVLYTSTQATYQNTTTNIPRHLSLSKNWNLYIYKNSIKVLFFFCWLLNNNPILMYKRVNVDYSSFVVDESKNAHEVEKSYATDPEIAFACRNIESSWSEWTPARIGWFSLGACNDANALV